MNELLLSAVGQNVAFTYEGGRERQVAVEVVREMNGVVLVTGQRENEGRTEYRSYRSDRMTNVRLV